MECQFSDEKLEVKVTGRQNVYLWAADQVQADQALTAN